MMTFIRCQQTLFRRFSIFMKLENDILNVLATDTLTLMNGICRVSCGHSFSCFGAMHHIRVLKSRSGMPVNGFIIYGNASSLVTSLSKKPLSVGTRRSFWQEILQNCSQQVFFFREYAGDPLVVSWAWAFLSGYSSLHWREPSRKRQPWRPLSSGVLRN